MLEEGGKGKENLPNTTSSRTNYPESPLDVAEAGQPLLYNALI